MVVGPLLADLPSRSSLSTISLDFGEKPGYATPERRLRGSRRPTVAFTDNEVAIRIDGVTGSESWANSWTVRETDVSADINDVGAALHTFYDGLSSAFWTAQTSATSGTWRTLTGSDSGVFSWASITGANAGPLLPTECAIRISATAPFNRHGGCFLTGFRGGSLDTGGVFTGASDVATLITTLWQDVFDANYEFVLADRVALDVNVVNRFRVGEVFDVIRKRRNDLPEAYQDATPPS